MTDYFENGIELADIANVFDELTFWSSRFGALLFKHLELRQDERILDIGCATGFPLFELAQVHGRTPRVVGIDIWQEALKHARAKLRAYALTNVELITADGARLPFRDASFDLIASNLGINNFDAPPQVLSECFRVLKPSARLVLTTNVKGHYQEFYQIYREVLTELKRPEYLERLAENENHRGTKDSVRELMEQAGFDVKRIIEESFTSKFLNGGALFNHWLTRIGFLDGWRSVVDIEDERSVFERLERRLDERAAEENGLKMTVPMLFIEAVKPDVS